MRILFLAHRIPYPPNKGDKIRSYHHVRHLAQRHEVHLLAFVDEPADQYAGWESLRDLCASVELIPLRKTTALLRGLLSLAGGRSLSEGYFGSAAMTRAVTRRAAAHSFDLAWAFSSTMAQYLPASRARRTIADFVDVDSEKWRQYGEDGSGALRAAYRLEATRMRAFESRMSRTADAVLFVSPEEARLFRTFGPAAAHVGVIPMGVDTAYFTPGQGPRSAAPVLLFTGALDYRPNVEAVLFAAREILPLVRREFPAAHLLAVGHRPARRLRTEAARLGGGLRIAGSVPDVRPFFAQASVYIAPLRLGRGVQNKILEAMAMQVPIVASHVALIGIEARAGEHAITCTSAEEFAAAIVTLLRHPDQGRAMTDAAALLIKDRYRWSANLCLLDEWTTALSLQAGATSSPPLPSTAMDASPSCSHA